MESKVLSFCHFIGYSDFLKKITLHQIKNKEISTEISWQMKRQVYFQTWKGYGLLLLIQLITKVETLFRQEFFHMPLLNQSGFFSESKITIHTTDFNFYECLLAPLNLITGLLYNNKTLKPDNTIKTINNSKKIIKYKQPTESSRNANFQKYFEKVFLNMFMMLPNGLLGKAPPLNGGCY